MDASPDQILDKIRDLAADLLGIDGSEITRDSNLAEDFDADSLDLVELALNAKSEFGVEIPKEDLPSLTTVGAVVDYISTRQAA